MSEIKLGIIGGGQLGSMLAVAAKKLNVKKISLETGAGKFFEPARKLFHKSKFEPCEPFAHYKEDKNSIYLTKLINNI